MEDIIKLLPDSLANQIAAGEVVQRPASVLKELMENAMDAKSQSIQVVIKEAGKILIQVIDDGTGMSERDARMSFERHATSKIRSTDDLFHIRTMGFRGEALASIAAVAEVELKTRRKTEDIGTLIRIEGSEFKTQEDITCLYGTSIAVKNLFFNVPARKNFLKSNSVEMKHILDEFHKVALANPEIEFTLYNNEQEVYQLSKGKLSNRIVELFGKNYKQQLAYCEEETSLLKIRGYIGKPEFSKKSRGEQFFFINNRFIRHSYLHHAVMAAYQDLIAKDHFPFYVLMIEIEPQHIDINVHPQKTEIKFDDERSIYAVVHSAVRKALSTNHLTPSLDFDYDVNFTIKAENSKQNIPKDFSNQVFKKDETQREKNNRVNWSSLYDELEKKAISQEQYQLTNEDLMGQTTLIIESAANEISSIKDFFYKEDILADSEKMFFQINSKYIVLQMKTAFMILDQQAARERILHDRFEKNLSNNKNYIQQLLFPIKVELNPADFQLVSELENEIRNLGFDFDVLTAEHSLILKGVPFEADEGEIIGFFEGFIEQSKHFKETLLLEKNTSLLRSLARKLSLKSNSKLSQPEIKSLIEQLFSCSNPNYTPFGKKIYVTLDSNQLDSFFM